MEWTLSWTSPSLNARAPQPTHCRVGGDSFQFSRIQGAASLDLGVAGGEASSRPKRPPRHQRDHERQHSDHGEDARARALRGRGRGRRIGRQLEHAQEAALARRRRFVSVRAGGLAVWARVPRVDGVVTALVLGPADGELGRAHARRWRRRRRGPW